MQGIHSTVGLAMVGMVCCACATAPSATRHHNCNPGEQMVRREPAGSSTFRIRNLQVRPIGLPPGWELVRTY